jgi:hypothetical protein
MQSILNKRRLIGLEDNWTLILGQIMGVVNSQEGQKQTSVASYMAIFGQSYHTPIKVSVDAMGQCQTISERLRISRDDRLEKFVNENDIIDLDEGSDEEFVDEMLDEEEKDEINVDEEDKEETDNVDHSMMIDDDEMDSIIQMTTFSSRDNLGENVDDRKLPPEELHVDDMKQPPKELLYDVPQVQAEAFDEPDDINYAKEDHVSIVNGDADDSEDDSPAAPTPHVLFNTEVTPAKPLKILLQVQIQQ